VRVTVHYAQSLDGRIATRSGDSQWIGGQASLRFAHQLRAEHELILVGVGTVLADNPRLTVRLVEGRSPTRVVLDSTLRTPLDAHVLSDGAAPTIVATSRRAATDRIEAVRAMGAEVLLADAAADDRPDLGWVLSRLSDRGYARVLIEGGRGIITSALAQGLVDRLAVCVAPIIVGEGISAVGELGIQRLRDARTLRSVIMTQLEGDLIVDGELTSD
jgi:5-amino-6-(5-phosphoribosylamino)uracil reductase/diaminohydroxyphosphoribosylaminopyrimidine deaminase/5-amino-6-(5-phosphoribosylamino)uracil reductase